MALCAQVEKLVFGGEGLVRVDRQVVFIPFVAPGEVIEFEITEQRKKFARGKLIKVIQEAGNRVPAPCPYFGTCGGCQLQHLTYEAQLEYKKNAVKEALQKIGNVQHLPHITMIGAEQRWE